MLFRTRHAAFLLLLLPALAVSACSPRVIQVTEDREEEAVEQSYYRNHPNSLRISNQINESLNSVKRIQNTVYYRTFHFNVNNPPRMEDLVDVRLERVAVETSTDNHTVVGTAVALTRSRTAYLMLTAAHVVTTPDTVWHYIETPGPSGEQLVEAVSVRVRNSFLVFGTRFVMPFEVAATDSRRDLALLTASLGDNRPQNLRPLQLRAGNTQELNWADMVYTIGFPKGNRMITSGIVSRTDVLRNGGFTIDSSFNRGFSGGIVLAVRNNPLSLEWVGMLNSVSADTEYLLTPGSMSPDEYQPDLPFTDPPYVQRFSRINYGIGYAIGLPEIENFVRENGAVINRAGFSVPSFR